MFIWWFLAWYPQLPILLLYPLKSKFGNLACSSTYCTNVKKPHSQQKHAIRIVHNEAKFERTKGLFLYQQIHWIYINLINLGLLYLCIKFIQNHLLLLSLDISRGFSISIRWSTPKFLKPKLKLTKTKYRISIRVPTIWNDFFGDCLKYIENTLKLLFSKQCKT